MVSREQVHELGFEGDALDATKFKQMIKSTRPWYMTFVRTNDAKGLVMWLKRAVNSLAVSKWSKASACLNLLTRDRRVVRADHPSGLSARFHRLLQRAHGATAHAPRAVGQTT